MKRNWGLESVPKSPGSTHVPEFRKFRAGEPGDWRRCRSLSGRTLGLRHGHDRNASLGAPVPPLRARSGRTAAGAGGQHRRPARDCEAPPAARRVRLHRRRCRGRAHVGAQHRRLPRPRVPTARAARRLRHRSLGDGAREEAPHPAHPRADGLRADGRPRGRTRGRALGRARRASVHALDAEYALDRRGRERCRPRRAFQSGKAPGRPAPLVPGLRLEGP